MPFNPNSPQETQQFYQDAIKHGADPKQVQQYIQQKKAAAAPVAPQGQSLPAEPPSLGGFGKNIISSGVDTVKGIGSALINVLNPNMEKNTVANLARLSAGAAQLLDPTSDNRYLNSVPVLGDLSKMTGNQEDTARAVGSYYSDRYGVGDALKGDFKGAAGKIGNTLYNDPVGAALDASMVLDAGGSVLGKIGDASKIEKLSQAGKLVKDAGEMVDPLKIVGKGLSKVTSKLDAGKVGGAVVKAGEDYALQGIGQPAAVEKFTAKYGPMQDFMKKYGISGADSGKLEDVIAKAQRAFDDIARHSGRIVDMKPVYEHVQQVINEIKSSPVQGVAENADTLQATLDHLQNVAGDAMDIGKATEARIAFDKLVKDFKTDPAKMGVNQIMRNSLQEGIQEAAKGLVDAKGQDLAAQGMELSKMYSAQPILERAATRGSLKTPFGLGKMAASSVGGAMGGIPGAIAGYSLESLATSPKGVGAISGAIKSVGKGIQKTPNLGPIYGAIAETGAKASRLLPEPVVSEDQIPNDMQGNPQGNQSYDPHTSPLVGGLPISPADAQVGQTGSSSIISQASAQQKPDTLNEFGATPKQIYSAWVKAATSGNKKKAAILKGMYDDEVKYQKTQGTGKSLSAGQAKELSDLSNSSLMLDELSGSIDMYKDKMGPIQGRISEKNSYDTTAQVFNGQMNIAAQVIGKALEGGKLTDPDIARYRKMLPNITDLPATARQKLKDVQNMLNLFSKNKEQFYSSNTITPDISPFLQSDSEQGGGGGTLPLRPPVLQNY